MTIISFWSHSFRAHPWERLAYDRDQFNLLLLNISYVIPDYNLHPITFVSIVNGNFVYIKNLRVSLLKDL